MCVVSAHGMVSARLTQTWSICTKAQLRPSFMFLLYVVHREACQLRREAWLKEALDRPRVSQPFKPLILALLAPS